MNAKKVNNDQKFEQIDINQERPKRQNNIQTQKFVCYQNQALKILPQQEC